MRKNKLAWSLASSSSGLLLLSETPPPPPVLGLAGVDEEEEETAPPVVATGEVSGPEGDCCSSSSITMNRPLCRGTPCARNASRLFVVAEAVGAGVGAAAVTAVGEGSGEVKCGRGSGVSSLYMCRTEGGGSSYSAASSPPMMYTTLHRPSRAVASGVAVNFWLRFAEPAAHLSFGGQNSRPGALGEMLTVRRGRTLMLRVRKAASPLTAMEGK